MRSVGPSFLTGKLWGASSQNGMTFFWEDPIYFYFFFLLFFVSLELRRCCCCRRFAESSFFFLSREDGRAFVCAEDVREKDYRNRIFWDCSMPRSKSCQKAFCQAAVLDGFHAKRWGKKWQVFQGELDNAEDIMKYNVVDNFIAGKNSAE